MMRWVAIWRRLLDEGELVVVSTRTHGEALLPFLSRLPVSDHTAGEERRVDDGA